MVSDCEQDKSVQDIHAITRAPDGKVVTVVQRMRVEGGAAVRRDISEVLCETIDALSEGAASGATALVVYSLSEVPHPHFLCVPGVTAVLLCRSSPRPERNARLTGWRSWPPPPPARLLKM